MKLILPATALVVLATGVMTRAEEPSTGTAAPAALSPPPPIVRLPVAGESAAPTPPSVPATTTATTAPATAPAATPGTPAPTAGGASLGWSSDGVGLRSAPSNLRTNRSFETRGSVPRLVKPQRRTVGGFLTGFANLFNPFAPTSDGVAARSANLYDGQYNVAPLPHGFRDERSHEPSAVLFSMPLEADPGEAKKPAPRAEPVR